MIGLARAGGAARRGVGRARRVVHGAARLSLRPARKEGVRDRGAHGAARARASYRSAAAAGRVASTRGATTARSTSGHIASAQSS